MLYAVSFYDWDYSAHRLLYSEKVYNEKEFKELCDKVYDEVEQNIKSKGVEVYDDAYLGVVEKLSEEYGFKEVRLLDYEIGISRRVMLKEEL